MLFSCEALWIQKAGNLESEYEDAFWPRPRACGENCKNVSVAVADGATESSFSGVWAKQLVRACCHGGINPVNIGVVLPSIQSKWSRIVRRKPLPWYAEEKIRNGAFSTVLGLTLRDGDEAGNSGYWEAFAIGDSCLVQIRGDDTLATFPLSSYAEFNNSPFLLGSNPDSNNQLESHVQQLNGCWEAGDSFYLMSDAIAAWFFREIEERRKPWRTLRDLDHDRSLPFRPWVEALREQKLMKNDDVTLFRIDIS
jgi:hypothetical protein